MLAQPLAMARRVLPDVVREVRYKIRLGQRASAMPRKRIAEGIRLDLGDEADAVGELLEVLLPQDEQPVHLPVGLMVECGDNTEPKQQGLYLPQHGPVLRAQSDTQYAVP